MSRGVRAFLSRSFPSSDLLLSCPPAEVLVNLSGRYSVHPVQLVRGKKVQDGAEKGRVRTRGRAGREWGGEKRAIRGEEGQKAFV